MGVLFMDFEDSVDDGNFMAFKAEYSDVPALNALAAHGEEQDVASRKSRKHTLSIQRKRIQWTNQHMNVR